MDAEADTDTEEIPRFFLSEMKTVWTRPGGTPRLVMDDISAFASFDSWPAMSNHLATELRYPKPQRNKYESYGWLPFLFAHSRKTVTRHGVTQHVLGTYRRGEHEIDATCVLLVDVDNKRTDIPAATMAVVAERLAEAGLAHLMYETFSSSALLPKFRLIVPLDGLATRHKLRTLFLWMQDHILFGQADGTIYDPSDFVFGPCFLGSIVQADGAVLPIDSSIEWVMTAISAEDQEWLDEFGHEGGAPSGQTPEQRLATTERMRTWVVTAGMSINDPAVCNPEWLTKYANDPPSHNEEIGRVMSRIWKRSGGLLGIGDMVALYEQVDALAGGYCADKYHHDGMMDRLTRIMKTIPTAPDKQQQRRIENDRLATRLRTLNERRSPPATPTPTV